MDQDYGTPPSPPPAFPYYGPPVYTRPPRRRRALVISLIALLLVGAITVTAVLTLNSPYRLQGNAGVVAAYEYACSYMQQSERLTGGTPSPEITKRLGAEPFEIDCALSITSDQFEENGMPLRSVPVGIDVKYDMIDLGMKMSGMGFQVLGAFVIEDEFVLNIAGKAGSEKIELPIEAELDQPMALAERFIAFLPFLTEDRSDLYLKILEAFAQSVPDEYTDTYTLNIYSPAAGKDVKTLVVETELDSAAITEVIQNFADRLQDDEELVGEIQTLADEVTDYFSLDAIDITEELDQLEKLDESAVNSEISWQVYKREGRYSGMSVTVTQPDSGTTTMLSEFYNNVFYTSTKAETSYSTSETYSVNTYDGSRMMIEAQTISNSEYMSGTMRESIIIEYTKVGADEYTGDLEMTIDQAYTYTYLDDTSEDTQISVDLTGDIDFRFGEDLKTLKESPGWDDIYKMEWGTLEDAMQGIYALGEMLGGSLDFT